MPAVSTIILADNVPANHTFSPTKGDSTDFQFNERTISATSAGQEVLRLRFSEASASRKTNKVNVKLTMPFEQVVDGVTVVYDEAIGEAAFTLPETMTAAQRLKFGTLMRAALAHATVKGYYETLEPVWS